VLNGAATAAAELSAAHDEEEAARCRCDGPIRTLTVFAYLSYRAAIEGWIVIVTGIDEEATEEEVIEKFAEYGRVQNCHLNLDRRTGYVKGYALLEFQHLTEAKQAVEACRKGLTLMDKPLKADFAFHDPPPRETSRNVSSTTERGAAARNRSRSPSPRHQ
jgi:RNA-binding protein 8A